jgi:predicted aspartyl protease
MKRLAALMLLLTPAPLFAAATAWTPFDIEDGHIYVDVTLNGQPARALVDSGASGNAISMAFINEHGIDYTRGREIIVTGINGQRTTNYVENMNIGMFGLELEIDHLMPYDDAGFDFIIGLPVFNMFVIQIDYPGQQIRLITHDSVDMKKFENVRMERATNSIQPAVRVDLNGEDKPWLIFDTGSTGGILLQRMRAEELGWLERYATEESSIVGFTGDAAGTEQFRLPTMTIGPFTLENVLVTVPAEGGTLNMDQWRPGESTTGSRIKSSKTAMGILGYDILKHFIVTVDFKRSMLNLDVPR